MTSYETHASDDRHAPRDTVGSLLAVGSMVLAGIGAGLGLILEQDARPARLTGAAMLLALIAAAMTRRHQRLVLAAIVLSMVAWVVGMTLAVITENDLY